MKKAATMLIVRDNQVLCVSRRNSKYYGLAGGKVEEGEDILEAAKRETYEETGIIVYKARHIFTDKCGEYVCSTFLAEDFEGEPTQLEEGIDVQWLDKDVLINSNTGAYPEYNYEVLKRVFNL